MPFDGTGYERRVQALDKMDKVIDLLSDERRWCKRTLRTRDGRRCIVGAIMAADAMAELKAPVLLAVEQVSGQAQPIESFNDLPWTTHADVMKVLRQARENILTGRSGVPTPRAGALARLWSVFC